MKFGNVTFYFLAFFFILTEPYWEFAYRGSFILELTNLAVLFVYAAVALAFAALLTRYPSRLLGAVLFAASLMLFVDLRLDLINSLGLKILYYAIPGLVVLWVIGQNAGKILSPIFGVMLGAVFLVPPYPHTQNFNGAQSTGPSSKDLPVFVHIILDEQIGVEGIGTDISGHQQARSALKDFFISNDFRLYGRAYSDFFDTNDSLASMLNFRADENATSLYRFKKQQNINIILQNDYFRSLSSMGYKIRIYQNTFVDFCSDSKDLLESCLTYKSGGVSTAALAQLDPYEKFDLRLSMIWSKSFIKEKLRSLYNGAGSFVQKIGVSLPHWSRLGPITVGPIPTLPIFDSLIDDVSQAPPGTMFFAHMLVPHRPYTVTSSCDIRRPFLAWNRIGPAPVPVPAETGYLETVDARQNIYDEYFQQTNCALSKLSEMVEAIKARGNFDNTIILVHGDHGSRIVRMQPKIQNIDRLKPQDFYDGFSTLFAVKAPQFAAGYDLTMLSLTQLLGMVMEEKPSVPETVPGYFVYLRDDQDSIRRRVPMPEIPIADSPASN